jgi:RNA polymerase sigma factor (sigma-70 family)
MMQALHSFEKTICSIWPLIGKYARIYGRQFAEDIAQDVALRIMQRPAVVPPRPSTRWVEVVVRNVANDRFRRLKKENLFLDRNVNVNSDGTVIDGEDKDFSYVAHQAVYEDHCDRIYQQTVREAVDSLTPRHREVLELFAEGFNYFEIADRIATDVGTVRSRLHYARKNALKVLDSLDELTV